MSHWTLLSCCVYSGWWFHSLWVLQALLHWHGKIPPDVQIHSPVPRLSVAEILHPSLVSYQRFMCCFAPLIKHKMFWEFSRQFMSHFCQCRPWTSLLSGWKALPWVQFSPIKSPNKAQWEKDLAKTGHWQVELGQFGHREHQWKLSHCPQKHKLSMDLKTELPAQTGSWSTHQVHPTQYPSTPCPSAVVFKLCVEVH